MSYTIGKVAALLGLEYQGDGTCLLEKVSRWDAADGASLVFLESGEHKIDPGVAKSRKQRGWKISQVFGIEPPPCRLTSQHNGIFLGQGSLPLAEGRAVITFIRDKCFG